MKGRHLAIAAALAVLLAAQAGWSAATTSGTYDETTYLGFGRALYRSLDGALLAGWGTAPLPVLLTTAAPVFAGSPSYPRAIALARASAIVFIAVPLVIVIYWTLLDALGATAAATGTALVCLSPNILAHASLATTDICFMAAALAAMAALVRFLEQPSIGSRALLGLSLAVALAAKYSALSLFVIVAVASFAVRGRRPESAVRRAVGAVALAAGFFGTALLFAWMLLAFALAPWGFPPIENVRLPASLVGIGRQLHVQMVGEPGFLLGRRAVGGWWYYEPAALAMKSTPAELVVIGAALVALLGRWRGLRPRSVVWRIAFVVFAVIGITNRIPFGVRYVLVLVPLSIFLAADWWFERGDTGGRQALVAGALVAAQLVSAVSIGPHYLSYFNRFAGGADQGYLRLADSNVDWGQDLPALKVELARLGAKRALLSYFGTAPVDAYGVEADRWDGTVQDHFERWDWVAISATNLDGVFLPGDPFADFRALGPGARAGYSILLYPTERDDVRRAMASAAARMR